MILGLKLLTKDGKSLNSTHDRVKYPSAGSWVDVPGNGAYIARTGGLISGGYGPVLAVIECDPTTRKATSAPAGVECFGRVRRVPGLEAKLTTDDAWAKTSAAWVKADDAWAKTSAAWVKADATRDKAYAALAKADAAWAKAEAAWVKADDAWVKADATRDKAYAAWAKVYHWLREQEAKPAARKEKKP